MIDTSGEYLGVELFEAPTSKGLEKMINDTLKGDERIVQDIQYNHSVLMWPDSVAQHTFSAMIIRGSARKYL